MKTQTKFLYASRRRRYELQKFAITVISIRSPIILREKNIKCATYTKHNSRERKLFNTDIRADQAYYGVWRYGQGKYLRLTAYLE